MKRDNAVTLWRALTLNKTPISTVENPLATGSIPVRATNQIKLTGMLAFLLSERAIINLTHLMYPQLKPT